MFRNAGLVSLGLSFLQLAFAASRTSPPADSFVVRAGSTTVGEYANVSSAVAALPNDSSPRSIFIYPGNYDEQVYITRVGPLTIYGYTTDTTNYTANQVTIQASVPASTAGSDDASGTLRIHKDNFKMYNVNIKNNYGIGSQAIALSQYGTQVGIYACGLYGYQDTLYANQGVQVYLKSYIEGAVDFIFGARASAYFGGNTIAVKGPGCITASGRNSNDTNSYVFESNKIVLASGAASTTATRVFLGRPWRPYAKVIFKDTVANFALNNTIWSVWNPTNPQIDDVFFAEYNSQGAGFTGAERPSFATVLTATQASAYTISSAVGSNYTSWVDTSYLV